MASSIKVTLRKKPNKQGEYPLVLRITKDRRSTYLYTGQYIDLKYWDETNRTVRKSHPNAVRLNNLLLVKLAEANKTLLALTSEKNDYSSQSIKKEITTPLSKVTFKQMADAYLEELNANKKINRYNTDKARINHLLRFAQNNYLTFREIDEAFLRRFISYLKGEKKLSPRSVINTLIVIRTLYNRSIKQGVIERKHYPFGKDKIRIKFPETEKVGLNKDEIQAIEALDALTAQEAHVRNVWLFSFYLAGMRVGDVINIRWSDIYDGRLHYRMNKNAKLLSLKLPEKVIPIIGNYKEDKKSEDDFIFPEMKKANLKNARDVLAKTKTATKKFNKYLSRVADKAKIDKKLTMHIARHSFGNIAGDAIPLQMLQKLYRHTSITTTINYQANFMHQDTDDALDKVINF
ncbi:site-specific integrase [Flagellimonas sediminis]|uniref:Tyrosine-type recombinase/integrase n=1 Tax=Flagellimonas sediminis TaxID=2696468 RepID=A0A6I5KRB9_9FLAO|nr:site-specific integrase [Allomuricauda sediminis]NDV43336.1 tyrosine-type recombinase/integrase [Allomuricauda sediminis]|tara:strand:+ start:194 stop:1408 length:1215 start_codon:yes stop_codon:yes gene_type:complete